MQLLLFPHLSPHEPDAPLSFEQQQDILHALLRGGSPQAACQKLRADPHSFCRAADVDGAFRERLRQVRELMTLNVVATVYRAAMEGTPAAQALWLRTFSPPDWAEASSNSSDNTTGTIDDFAALPTDAIRDFLEAFHEEFSPAFTSAANSESA